MLYTGRVLGCLEGPVVNWPGGVSRQLFAYPPGTDRETSFVRVSEATMVRDSNFTPMPRDRMLVSLRGKINWEDLDAKDSEGRAFLFQPFNLHRFDGSHRTKATLLEGPFEDFNVMTDPGKARSCIHIFEAQDLKPQRWSLGADFHLLFCARGSFKAQLRGASHVFDVSERGTLVLERMPIEDSNGSTYLMMRGVRAPAETVMIGVSIFLLEE